MLKSIFYFFSSVTLNFILFLGLMFFSAMFCVHQTVLNPSFIVAEINKVNFSTVVTHVLNDVWEEKEPKDTEFIEPKEQDPFEEYAHKLIIKAVSNMEPELKTGIDNSVHSTFEYLLDDKKDPEVATMLRTSFFTKNVVSSLLESMELDIVMHQLFGLEQKNMKLEKVSNKAFSSLIDSVMAYLLFEKDHIDLKEELRKSILNKDFCTSIIDGLDIPSHMSEPVFTSVIDYMDSTLPENMSFLTAGVRTAKRPLKSWIRSTLINNSTSIANYLTDKEEKLTLQISIVPALQSVHPMMFKAFTRNLSEKLTNKSDSEIRVDFEKTMNEAFSLLSKKFEVDIPTAIGEDFRSAFHTILQKNEIALKKERDVIRSNIAVLETQLASMKEVVGGFVYMYNVAIVGVLVVIGMLFGLGFMKGETRNEKWKYIIRGPGLTLACTGILQLLFIGSIQTMITSAIQASTPQETFVAEGIFSLVESALASTTWLSIFFVILGIALAIGSFFLHPQEEELDYQEEEEEWA